MRPRLFDAGGVAGGEELVARLVVRLVVSSFFEIFGRLGHGKSAKIGENTRTGEKLEKKQ